MSGQFYSLKKSLEQSNETRKGKQKMNNTKTELTEVCEGVFTTDEQRETIYDTNSLIDTFKEIKKDGITAISFSLLVDLVNDRAAR